MKLSKQAMGAVMMALQNSLLDQSDIVPVLDNFDFVANENNELFVKNAPIVKFDWEEIKEEDLSETPDIQEAE